MSLSRALSTLAAMACLAVPGLAAAGQDQQHYQKAVSDNSTSPYFVLVTITDDNSGTAFTGCVPANLLKGAIFRELGGDWGQPEDAEKRQTARAVMARADEIALKSTDHEFHFSNPAALANIPVQYTPDELAEARKLVQSVGVTALGKSPDAIDRRTLGKLQWSAALACAIIEQGWSARRADITAQIYAEP
jgi:hypothetical protein